MDDLDKQNKEETIEDVCKNIEIAREEISQAIWRLKNSNLYQRRQTSMGLSQIRTELLIDENRIKELFDE